MILLDGETKDIKSAGRVISLRSITNLKPSNHWICQKQIAPAYARAICLAGSAGFEPANAGTKTQCLTTWRRSIATNNYSTLSYFRLDILPTPVKIPFKNMQATSPYSYKKRRTKPSKRGFGPLHCTLAESIKSYAQFVLPRII